MTSVIAQLLNQPNKQFMYTIRGGDTLSSLAGRFYGANTYGSPRYKTALQHLLYFNPSIKDPSQIKIGQLLLVVPFPSEIHVAQICKAPEDYYKQQTSLPAHRLLPTTPMQSGVDAEKDSLVWALGWLEHNYNFLSMPGGAALGSAGNLLSQGNIALLGQVNQLYADYKSGKSNMTKGQYDYARKKLLDNFKRNIGPVESILFGNKTTHETIRIARGGGFPASAKITDEISRLNRFASLAKGGGVILTVVGLGVSCRQIANEHDRQKKNEILVESIGSVGASTAISFGIGLFLISNPIGWGTALVLATGTTVLSFAAGQEFKKLYSSNFKEVDIINAINVDLICK
ncbi:MAG: LysM peptidoglycan-binding domain-containing protein [Pseudomonadales bacterium]|nr:LysM peptidoglycan-binding domain-containing protein [Pseudomonadales bacterium]